MQIHYSFPTTLWELVRVEVVQQEFLCYKENSIENMT